MKILKQSKLWLAVLGLVAANVALLAPKAFAGALSQSNVIEYNMQASGTSAVAISFKTASAGATSVSVNFGSWGGSVNAAQTVSNTGCTALTGASAGLPGSITAAGSGSTITISSVTALSASTTYCTVLTSASAVTNPSAAGTYSATVTAGSDSQTDAIDVISNDQYTVNATVAPTFTLSLGGSTDSFSGNLSAAALSSTTGMTATVSTNAASGWMLWAEDSNGGLKSTQQNHTITSVATGSSHAMNGGALGSEAYGLGVTTANATANYADAGGITAGGLSNSAYSEIASAGSAGSNVSVTMKELADISSGTPPATDYSDTISVIGAGSF